MALHPHQPYQPVYQKGIADAEIQSYHSHHSGPGNSNDASEASSPENKAYSSAEAQNTTWKIGWMTPLIIMGCYIFAILTAVAHYIYCRSLDKRTVEDTLPQSWASTISITFARVFSLSLVGSASPAFTQLLWWLLRRKSLSLKHIDAMFSLNSSPLKLYILGVLRAVPVLWLFALVLPLISVATIFPPGSLVVDMIPQSVTIPMRVPNLDLNYRGNGTLSDLYEYAIWIQATDGVPGQSKLEYTAIGVNVLLGNGYLTRSSPCGANCTYNLSFEAPSLHCEDVQTVSFSESNDTVLGDYPATNQGRFNSRWAPSQANFMAAIKETNQTILGASTDKYYTFDLSFKNGTEYLKDHQNDTQTDPPLRNISCVLMSGTYISTVKFLNGTQTVNAKIVDEKPLNATALSASSLFYDAEHQGRPGVIDISRGESHTNFQTNGDLEYAFGGTQMRIMAEVLLNRLGGAISAFGGSEGDFTTNTIIKDTPFALPVVNSSSRGPLYTDLTFNLSPSILEDMMKNVSISFFNRATNFTRVTATTTPYKLSYVFTKTERLIISYALALGVSLVFITIGFATMLHNGVSASTGGFLQIMCTTTHGESKMNQLARRACLGGESNIPKELLGLKVRFGEVDQQSGQGRRVAAFGTEDETRVLLATNLAAE